MRLILAIVLISTLLICGCSQVEESKQAGFPHPDLLFTTSQSCYCHDNLKNTKNEDVSILSDWSQTVHSNAAVDPYFLAKMSSEIAEFPQLEDLIRDECARCHTPMSFTQEKVKSGDYPELALEGVSCTVCHQISEENFGKEESFSGHYLIDLETRKPERKIFGPFYPFKPEVMSKNSGYIPEKGGSVRRAELCAICHTLYNPTVENGEITGKFPEQTPYLEWLNSAYSGVVKCQDCHMRGEKAKVTTMPQNSPLRDMKAHIFAGANVQLLTMQGDEKGAERALKQLRGGAEVKIESAEFVDGKLVVKVRVENNAGHKFPTGFPSRRAFLHLIVEDSEGIKFESGKYDKSGRIEGEDEPYEPHHDVIDSEDEVQIYESVMVDRKGEVTATLLRASKYIKDNRLLPLGFKSESAHPDTAVRGEALNDVNFVDGSDTVTYIIDSSLSSPVRVKVELLYQPVSYRFLTSLHPTDETKEFLEKFEEVEKVTLVDSDEVITPAQKS